MAINVAGTNAIGDYLLSEIRNARTLIGAPQADPAPRIAAPGGLTPVTSESPTRANLQAQVLAQDVANSQALFGIQGTNAASAGLLPPIFGETPHQLALVAIQSSNIASEFSNIATLFGSLGLGTNTNTNA